ncbi:hypothetical protein UFOVP257_430 [uncultured Caudovirales phage]|uniref:Uncharacterized protein n=1 Tax=uncultured Caudovirales phage TaxID=2100421 RepID=A0A6J5LG77_9CAUD|nr:hypothetical protein UFOVP257_430 [uncultured Caudovirales phage]
MQNSKKLEKSRGIVAFAKNTETTDYISIAKNTLSVASKVLHLPHTIITDVDDSEFINSRYDVDTESFVQWRNYGRHLAYDMSPYDETIVIDADYLVLDNSLRGIFDQPWDYLLQRKSHALTVEWETKMGNTSLPYVWATVFAFRKTERAKIFFDLVERVYTNYRYYRALFNIKERNYRNDYAFAIADIILNGYAISNNGIAGSMLAINQPINSIEIKDKQLLVKDSNRAYVVPRTNLHIMSKAYLQSANFAKLIEQLNEPA